MTHAPERTQAPNLLRALGLPIGCWGLTLGASVMLGVLVTFHELVSPFTIPDVVALVGQVVAGLALFLSWSWGYRLGLDRLDVLVRARHVPHGRAAARVQ